MYRLDLTGFQNSDRKYFKTLDEARKGWADAKKETYETQSFGKKVQCHWTMWELFENDNLVKEGRF